MSIDEEEGVKGKNKKAHVKAEKKKEQETYIRENEDTIVDLADPNAFSKITSEF
jgi:prophage maintenance system killer protein